MRNKFSICLLSVLGAMWAQAGEVPITRDGKACSVILISHHPESTPRARGPAATAETAAKDLSDYIQRISGASVEVRKIGPESLDSTLKEISGKKETAIVLGALAFQWLPQGVVGSSGFAIHADSHVVAVAGGDALGTEIGVHALLEQFGVRWFFPGELGTVVPETKTLSVKEQDMLEMPSFAARQFQLSNGGEWTRFQRTGGRYFKGAHGIKLPKGDDYESHPEIYAMVGGKRQGPQLCLSNPETLRFAVQRAKQFFTENPQEYWYGMGPEDKAGFCECERCKALDGGDWDAFSGELSMTDRYVWFFNQVLDALKKDYPDKKIAFYIYHAYMRPPVRVKPNPNIVGAIAPIALCRIHGMGNPICPERSYLKSLIAEWKKQINEIYERGYWSNLADPGMWFVQTSRLKDEISSYHQFGIEGFRTECFGNWAVEGPSLYFAGRLMWNADMSADVLLQDYCDKLFGPASTPMREYFTLIDQRLRDSDHHTGSAFNILQFYPADVREQLHQYIREAESLAKGAPYDARVALFSKGYAYANAFAEMLEAQSQQDWKTAQARLLSMDALREELVNNYDMPMLNAKATKSYADRFFRMPVEQGNARFSNNLGLVELSNHWSFLIDPNGIGESLGYYRDSPVGGNWQPISAVERSWSDDGLRYYKGLAWYRQEVVFPDEMVRKRVFLWLGGIDESARVWVNGKLIGNSPRSAFTPFELDATKEIRPGKNTVTVCVANQRVDELGTGGVTAPAFFYAPSGGDTAKLENVRPLLETFP